MKFLGDGSILCYFWGFWECGGGGAMGFWGMTQGRWF